MQIFGGPEFTHYRIPLGTTTSTFGASISVYANYALERGTISGGYNHGLSNGGGLLVGSIQDLLTVRASRRLTRLWSVDFGVGYANNRPVSGASSLGAESFNSTYINAGATRPFGRDFNMGIGYTASINNNTTSGCTGAFCNQDYNYQSVTLSFQWHARPFLIRSF